MGKMMTGLVAGAMVGAALGAVVIPQLDRKTQRKLRKTSNMLVGMAEDRCDGIMCKLMMR